MTFSIVAHSPDGPTGPQWGVAVASKFLAVGNAVPAAVAGIGAIATQASANVAWKGEALALLDEGGTAQVALDRLVEDDDKSEHRQAGIVDAEGHASTYTGDACIDWAGGLTDEGVAIQGNCLAGPDVVQKAMDAWLAGSDKPFAHRLLAALAAGDEAGGDKRGRQSAALLVVSEGAGYDGGDDIAADLRVDDHVAPIPELRRLLELNDFYLTATPEEERVEITPSLAAEIRVLVHMRNYDDLASWAGTENYEMRVAEDGSWIDKKVLGILRSFPSR